jgi:transcriptional regulator with XRE-family HTH domain
MANIDKIKRLAKSKGIKIGYIIEQLGLNETYFTDLKRGKGKMTPERLDAIAEMLDTTSDYLEDKTEIPEKEGVPIKLTLREKIILESMRDLTEKERENIETLIENLSKKK